MKTTDGTRDAGLSPDAAFAALGNQTRMGILRTLATAEEPLSFSTLRERVGVRDSGQFNYHLDKLDGHFIAKTDAGYALRQPGEYVVQAVLTGAMTESPELGATTVDFDCRFCGTPIEVGYSQGRVRLTCPSCRNQFTAATSDDPDVGHLATFAFPPAGVQDRTATELQEAAATWVHLDAVALSSGVCPRCSAAVDLTIDACPDHEPSERVCPNCEHVHGIRLEYRCLNCTYDTKLAGVMGLLATPELLAFVGEHGLNVTSKGFHWGWEYGEEVHATDPFEGTLTVDIDGDRLALTVDEDLTVIEAERSTAGTP